VGDVDVGGITSNATQVTVSAALNKRIHPALRQQNQAMLDFNAPDAEFSAQVRGAEADINNIYDKTGQGDAMYMRYLGIVQKHDDLVNALGDTGLSRELIEAYRKACYIYQRRFMNDGERETAVQEVKDACGGLDVPERGDTIIIDGKQSTVTGEGILTQTLMLKIALENALVTSMPAGAVPENGKGGGYDVLQQLGDFAQYEGFVDDVLANDLYPHEDVIRANDLNPKGPKQSISVTVKPQRQGSAGVSGTRIS
jgi:hypothetical protein